MDNELRGRNLLNLQFFSPREIHHLIDLAVELKRCKYIGNEIQKLKGKNIALIFEKPSTRTRCAFEVAVYDQGGHITYLDPISSHLGHKESIKDTSRTLSRLYDGIGYRGVHQAVVDELAKYSSVPVWNALTNEFHPTQTLADLLTMKECGKKPLTNISFCYLGDARFNIGSSLLVGGIKMGMDIRICAPRDFWPARSLMQAMRQEVLETGAKVRFEEDPLLAVKKVDFIYTDVWASMGEPKQVWKERIHQLKNYQVNSALLQATGNPDTKFMHCLPALHDTQTKLGLELFEEFGLNEFEVTDEIFESKYSIVFDQAENRMHTIKAVLVATLT